jgi:2,5-diketo-D-gluconate reductase B
MTLSRPENVMSPIPRIGLGTYGLTGDAGLNVIGTALEVGYRHLDTAQTYGTESNVGRAVAASGLPRADIFITTKVADTHLDRPAFLSSVRASLDQLDVDHVDLLLVHWPSFRDAVPFEVYIDALAEVQALGQARLIGVSNFPAALVATAVSRLGSGAIASNQVECHPFLQNRMLRAACDRLQVAVTAYMPLAVGRVTADPVLQRIASARGETPATVALAWALAACASAIPSSTRRDHLVSNLRALDLQLDADELAAVDALDRGERIVNPAKSPAWD